MSVKQIRHCLYCSAVAIYYFTGKLSRKGILPRRDHYASTGNQQYFWTTPRAHYLFLRCGKTRRARASQFVFVAAIAAVEWMETAQDPAGTSELVHALELWQFTPETSMIQWVKKKKTYLKMSSFMSLSFIMQLYQFMRNGANNMKMQNMPPLQLYHSTNPVISRTCRNHGVDGFCWGDKAPFPSPSKTQNHLLFSGNASCPPESSVLLAAPWYLTTTLLELEWVTEIINMQNHSESPHFTTISPPSQKSIIKGT